MKRVLLIISTIITFAFSQAILKLDTKGHTSMIKDIIVTKGGDIISASDDKTIRVWDSEGNEKRKILGQIGVGVEGMIFAIALSPNEEYLAVGGYLSYNRNYEYGNIRIYNYKTGKLLKILKSHTDVVLDLAFSSDGKYLVSGSLDKSLKVWDMDNFSLKKNIFYHNREVYGVKIVKRGSDYLIVSAGLDSKIALHSLKKGFLNSYKANDKLAYLANSSKYIAVCGDIREILIFDYNLNLIKKIESETKPSGLAFSENGNYLVAGSGSHPLNVNLYSVKENFKKITTFDKHTNLTMAVAFLGNEVVSGGGNNQEIYIWDMFSGKVKNKIEGVGQTIWSVGIDGDKIAWGNIFDAEGDYHKKQSSFQKSFDLKNFKVEDVSNQNSFNRISTINGNYSLSHKSGGNYGKEDATLEIKKNNKTIASITKDATNGIRHNCYGWYRDYIISGGSNGHLKIYNLEGKEVASLIGHTSEIWSIAIEGDRLVSGSYDQTIRIWNLKEIGEHSEIYPMLNLFVSKENEWVIWSKSGYYSSSIGGDKYIGFHINQGVDKEARFVSSDKFYKTNYRPDIIENIVALGNEDKAIAYASKTKRVKEVEVTKSLPPFLSLLSKEKITTKNESVKVEFSIESDSDIEELIVLVNGKRVNKRGLGLQKPKNRYALDIKLSEEKNIITIMARNKYALSDSIQVEAIKKNLNIEDLYKPTLYLLSIGVSEYKNSKYNLDVADSDAKAIVDMFKRQKGKIYKDVKTKLLINSKATSGNILDGLDWIDKEVTSKDIAIIFIAGHGVNNEQGDYYFLTHEANENRLRRTALPWYEIELTTNNLPSKVILLADTCHSGNIMGSRRDVTGAIKSIVNSGSGAIIMTATTGNGYSYEQNSWRHGAFTKALLEGLDEAKADFDRDSAISIKEIDLYITQRVKELTSGKQKPTTIIPKSVPDFAIGYN